MVPLASRTGQWYHVGLGLFLEERGQEEACWMPWLRRAKNALCKRGAKGRIERYNPFQNPKRIFSAQPRKIREKSIKLTFD